jgi:serine/threonine protein kinase
VLIDDDGRACLVDFGLIAVGGQSRTVTVTPGKAVGAYGWMAPEFFEDDEDNKPKGYTLRKTMAGDNFAFGRILLVVSQWAASDLCQRR